MPLQVIQHLPKLTSTSNLISQPVEAPPQPIPIPTSAPEEEVSETEEHRALSNFINSSATTWRYGSKTNLIKY